MRGRASLTATIVALGRGIGTRAGVADSTAAALVPGPAAKLLPLSRYPGLRLGMRLASLGLVDHVTLRTLAIDAAVGDAVRGGIDQLVLLGAGLDGRAFRLDALASVDVLEVDHPATQAVKRARIEPLPLRARSLAFLPVDFERQSLDDALGGSSHDPRRCTLWIWEGVTPYLAPPTIDATLAVIGARSATGSELAITYATPGVVPERLRALAGIVKAGFAVIGEPLRGLMTPGGIARRLEAVGFEVTSDTCAEDWLAHGPGSADLERPFRAERLAIARKT